MTRVITRHHKIRVDIINNREVRTVDGIWVDKYGYQFYVSPKFKTDGASVPSIFWWLGFSPFALDTLRAAIAHDYMFRCLKRSIPYFFANLIFLALMKESGASFIKRWLYFIMVSLFGWIPRNFIPFVKRLFL